ncbi:MAG: NAD(P)-binding domain-containing protein [Saprospiraceae bacterium]|nr:NAD(P)-binding domain-containing protein [Saprospiraceae bacterium]
MKTRIVILGSGNVAWHLAHNFVKAGCQVLEVYGRHPDRSRYV